MLVTEIWTEDVVSGEAALRDGVFQTVSTMTTTGFAIADFDTWPTLAMMTIVGLMFVGGSAGSTTGSVKVVRHLLLGKILRREIDQTMHPEIVLPVRLNRARGRRADPARGLAFILLYVGIFVVGAAVLAVDAARTGLPLTPSTRSRVVGDACSQRGASLRHRRAAGIVRAVQRRLDRGDDRPHVAGRLEIVPIIVLFSRHYWRNA